MAGQDNLVSLGDRTTEEQRAIASKGGKASVRSRRKRKLIADALRKVLDEPMAHGTKQTKLEGIAIKTIKKLFDDPDIRDVKVLAEVLGELKQTIEGGAGFTLNITTSSEEGKENIKKLMEG